MKDWAPHAISSAPGQCLGVDPETMERIPNLQEGSQADISPAPRAPGLTTMALSSMLLGKRLRPPNCKVFRRFCSQALAMPGGDGKTG